MAIEENSGLSCDYYKINVTYPYDASKEPYTAECGEVMEALNLSVYEGNIFKELWRQATARLGFKKKGNSCLRGAEKILWNAQRIYIIALRETEKEIKNEQ